MSDRDTSTYGGEINTPTLDRVAKMGISYNRFHSTAMCSPTRAALLTGRNHTFVGNGQIAALANDFDGFSGTIPKSSATVAEVLKDYGYNTGAWGKWHNTPEEQITIKGPFDYWPTGYGFEYFYGFLAGEASQYEPTWCATPPQVTEEIPKGYHLTEDIAEDAIKWLREQKAYRTRQAVLHVLGAGRLARTAPGHEGVGRQVQRQVRRRLGQVSRARLQARQGDGLDSQDAQLTPRPASMASWDSIPEAEKPFQRRLMEVFAGFTEHADYNAGRVIDEIERQGKLDNTLIFYIWGDNGSSAEGLNGTISEQLAQNGIPTKIAQHIEALERTRRPRCAWRAEDRQHVPRRLGVGGQHAVQVDQTGRRAFRRHPPADGRCVAAKIKADATPRAQFHHVIDIVPTIYELAKITPPRVVNGFEQDPIDGVSMVYTFADAKAAGRRKTQFFDIMASRGIYHDGWFASALARASRGCAGCRRHQEWSPEKDKWELYNLEEDWSQANDLAAKMPEKLEEMKDLFLVESRRTRTCRSAAACGPRCCSIRRTRPHPVHRMDLRRPHDPDAGIRRAQARQGRQHRQHGSGRASECQRRALRARRLSPADSRVREGRRTQLRVQPVRDPLARRSRPRTSCRPARRRSRSNRSWRARSGARWMSP